MKSIKELNEYVLALVRVKISSPIFFKNKDGSLSFLAHSDASGQLWISNIKKKKGKQQQKKNTTQLVTSSSTYRHWKEISTLKIKLTIA